MGHRHAVRPRGFCYATIRLDCRTENSGGLSLMAFFNSRHVCICKRSKYKDKKLLSLYVKHIFVKSVDLWERVHISLQATH